MENEILENAKMLLGISDSDSDELLLFLIDDTIGAVMKYCRIDVLPYQLYGLTAQMVAETYRSRGYGGTDLYGGVKSVTEGERCVEFDTELSCFGSYVPRLEPFINKSARLPSDMEVCDEQG
ncbi:MAG: phage head-tail connector protein [Oscillospiraceae bacterium]|nr:phage head-tail connector protein [Oscillospiraceae bacterium]